MKFQYYGFLLQVSLALTWGSKRVLTAAETSDFRLIGWYPCSTTTFAEELPPSTTLDDEGGNSDADCAVFKAPLCYDGVCDATNQTIEVFVKRIPASSGDPADYPSVFLMQGGPGAASTAMESGMTSLHETLNGNVNVYTMDHRGTGRSNKLECVASQVETTGSPYGAGLSPDEIANCAAELEQRYGGDLASFSITSAASDLDYFISNHLKGQETYVYGVSYGTAVVERLMHLENSNIAGYIMDGIATTSGTEDPNDWLYMSKWDLNMNEVGEYFLSFCESDDANCGKYFSDSQTALDTLQSVTTLIDSPSFTCALELDAIFAEVFGYDVGTYAPSPTLRSVMGQLLMNAVTRTLIPVITYRLQRCNSDDQQVLRYLIQTLGSQSTEPTEDSVFESTLLYSLIVFSDLWESPTPSYDEQVTRFLSTTMSSGSYSQVQSYCAFTKDTSIACDEYSSYANYDASPILYAKDKYWNVAAEPADASVLLMSSKMDPQTPHKYAETLYKAIKTDKKKLVTFEHATHAVLWTTPESDAEDAKVCGMEVLASYVSNGGDLSKLDTSCVDNMPEISFRVSDDIAAALLSTTDAYDGSFDEAIGLASDINDVGNTSQSSSSGGSSYKAVAIVFIILFVVAAVGGAFFLFKWRRAKASSAQDVTTPVYHDASNV